MPSRRTWMIAFVCLAAGCSMCQSPWDYAGPTDNKPSPYAGTTRRTGSVLNDGPLANAPTAAPDIPAPPPTAIPPEGAPPEDNPIRTTRR